MRWKGGTLLAISVDLPELSKRLADELSLPFRLLSDSERTVIHAYGLEHVGGGPDGETIAVPAQLLVAKDGRIAWKHVAGRIPDRAGPGETLTALAQIDQPPRRTDEREPRGARDPSRR